MACEGGGERGGLGEAGASPPLDGCTFCGREGEEGRDKAGKCRQASTAGAAAKMEPNRTL